MKRIDPAGCRCDDCLRGDSKPINYCSQEELAMMVLGMAQNHSEVEPMIVIVTRDADVQIEEERTVNVMSLSEFLDIVKQANS